MECPSETTLSDFLEGLLPEGQRTRVLAHVEGCEGCQELVAMGASSTVGVPEVLGERPALAQGATLARYVVLERIGRGAMGEVYAAYDPELDRQVALKLLRPEGRHLEELRVRLLREAQALARLAHPHVVTVHDVGVHGDCLFLALELVEGTTLAEWMRAPRPQKEVLRVFLDAGSGLAAAHAAGLVHRDFKPSNVLVGKDGRVRVTDFGLARPSNRWLRVLGVPAPPARVADRPGPAPLTRTGVLVGTPAYMAPEQQQGHGVDAQSDQFSFCVALYEALHGARPFEGNSLEELARAAREGRVRAPERESKVPARVRRAVLRGLRARPEERFPSMDALLAELAPRAFRIRTWMAASAGAASLLGLAVGYVVAHRDEARCAQEADKLATVWSPERRERIREAFLATGKPYAASAWETVSTALDAQASAWRSRRTDACLAARDAASASWQTAACLDARLWHLAAITDVLEKADAQTVQNAPQLVASLEGVSGCTDAPALATRPQPPDALRPRVDEARRRLAEARARMDAGNHAAALQVTTTVLQDVKGLDYRPLEAEVLTLHGYAHGLAGKLKEAEDILYKALWAAEAGRDDETVARVWTLLLWVVGDQMARMDEANRLVHHARAAVDRLGRERFPAVAMDLHLRMGGLLLVQGKLDEAEAEYVNGLELSRKVTPERLRTTYFLTGLGRVRSRQLRAEEALELYRQAQAHALKERQWSPEHPVLALNLNNIATELLALGRTDEALATFQRSLALLEAARSKDHVSLAPPLNNLAVLLRREGRLDEARQSYQRAIAIFERSKGKDHPSTVTALAGLGMVAYDSQQLDEALAYNQQALERLQRGLGADTPREEQALRNLGLIHLRAGRPAEARKSLQRAVRLLEQAHGPDSAVAGGALRDLARVDLSMGAWKAALARCQRTLQLDEGTQGAQSPDVALDLACLAEAQLGLGASEEAVPLLERARRIDAKARLDRRDAARISFLLARALWERRSPEARTRAEALAHEARQWLEAQGIRTRLELREVLAWQARHPPTVSEAVR